jgi:DMSO/TMAO reductase YedYZ molybdopterin-dependent catalytic subunit
MTDAISERKPVLAPLAAPAYVRLAGDVERPRSFPVTALRDLPQYTIEAEYVCAREGLRRHTFTGPLLVDLALAAGPRFDPLVTKDRLRFLLAVTGADGHTTVLSWGEIDAHYGHNDVMIAASMDGRSLEADGPHLAVPGDLAGGRYVSRITRIWVGPAERAIPL